jgi:hypothetical protein
MGKMIEIKAVEPKYEQSGTLGTGRSAPIAKTEYEAVHAVCGCGNRWRATREDRSLKPIIGGAVITCPGCNTSERFTNEELKSASTT